MKPPECVGCPYYGQPGPVEPDGPQDTCKYIPIGESPGLEEISEKRGLVGAAGREFWSLAGVARISRGDCRVMNIVRCLPPGKEYTLDPAAIKHCTEAFLWKELSACNPKAVILPLGGTVLATVAGVGPISRFRGSKLWKTF